MAVSAGPLSVVELVRDLVEWFDSRLPADHRCTVASLGYDLSLGYGDPRSVCTHRLADLPSMLDRLDDLVVPGTTPSDEGRHRHRPPRQESPAPWDRRVGELLDEVYRGAYDLVESVRRVLGFSAFSLQPAGVQHGPGRRSLLDQVGRAALRELGRSGGPLQLLGERRPDHWLVRGQLLSRRHPERGYRPGAVLAALRSWHSRALAILGFDVPRPRDWWWMPNPLSPAERAEYAVGPVCPGADGSARLPMQRVSCGHGSCLRVAFARMGEVAPLWCPDCWSRGVLVDQVSGEVSCRVCVDDDGDPTAWMSQQWALSTIRAAMRLAAGLR